MAIVQTLIGNVKGPQGIQGIQGETGAAGSAATISVGTTSTTAYGNPASVTNVGSSSEAILNFVIPQGAPGETVTTMDDLALNTITTATAEYPYPAIGDTGKTIFGKIIKFFQDLVSKKVDTAAVVNNFTTTEAGYVADARTAKTLMDALSTIHSITCPVGTLEYHCGYVQAGNIVAVEAVIALTSAVSNGGILLSGLPIQYANGAPVFAWNQTTSSTVTLAMNNQGQITTRSNIANGNSLRMNFCYRAGN